MSGAPHWDDAAVDAARLAQLHRLDRDHPLTEHEPLRTPLESLHQRVTPLTTRQRRIRSRAYRATLPRSADTRHDSARSAVLDRAGRAAALQIAVQVEQLQVAVDWAAEHTTATHGDPAEGGEQLVALAGEGAPLVAEFAIPELALALDVSTDSGRSLMADALELAHRLPLCWSALLAGGIAVFKARRVARATRDLNPAAGFVDNEVAPYLHAIGIKALDETVEHAIWKFDLPRALAESAARLDQRGITIDLDTPMSTETGTTGATCQVFGHLDRADALELEHAIATLAHHQLQAGSTDTLDIRRAKALGMLARNETPTTIPDLSPEAETRRAQREEWDDLHDQTDNGDDTDHDTEDDADDDAETSEAPAVVSGRRDVTLHVHLTDAALTTGTGTGTGITRLEGCPHPISVDQVRHWLTTDGAPDTTVRITVRPVLDLDEHLETPGYTPSADLAEQVVLRDRTCVFPHCTRDARRTDLDHVTPWHHDDTGGPTSGKTASDNLAALCRRHHRLKTHHPDWTYRVLHPGTYLWTTPTGQQVLRDPRGTHPI